MRNKNETARITLDLPTVLHKQLKMLSASLGKSMKKLTIEALEKHLRIVVAKNINKEAFLKNL